MNRPFQYANGKSCPGYISWFRVIKPDYPCFACGSSNWWYRPASELGGPAEWVCGRCHGNPNPSPFHDWYWLNDALSFILIKDMLPRVENIFALYHKHSYGPDCPHCFPQRICHLEPLDGWLDTLLAC